MTEKLPFDKKQYHAMLEAHLTPTPLANRQMILQRLLQSSQVQSRRVRPLS